MLIEIGQGERLVEDVPIISAFYGIVIRMFYPRATSRHTFTPSTRGSGQSSTSTESWLLVSSSRAGPVDAFDNGRRSIVLISRRTGRK